MNELLSELGLVVLLNDCLLRNSCLHFRNLVQISEKAKNSCVTTEAFMTFFYPVVFKDEGTVSVSSINISKLW